MPTETKDKPEAQKTAEYSPRRVKLIIGGARGKRFVDADTGEDLRLPTMSINYELMGAQKNVHLTMMLVAIESE